MASKAENKLRVFKDADDLLDNVDNDVILGWVNAHAKAVAYRQGHQKVYQKKRRLLVKYAAEMMDADELKRIGELAQGEVSDAEAAEDQES